MIEGTGAVLSPGVAMLPATPANDRSDLHRSEPDGDDVTGGEPTTMPQRSLIAHRFAGLGELAGRIAHDFRNILAVIESSLRLAETHASDPCKVTTCLAGARDGIDRGLKLTSQLLNVAKWPASAHEYVNVSDLIEHLETVLKYGAGPDVHVVLDLTRSLPTCHIDPAQFSAAVLNLVVNARDAMASGGEIRISTDRFLGEPEGVTSLPPGDYVRVRIADNGPGMPNEMMGRIFDPFFTTKGDRGTGLGLPQVAGFLRMAGGHVEVTSEVGIGTTFDLLFPIPEAGESTFRPCPAEATQDQQY